MRIGVGAAVGRGVGRGVGVGVAADVVVTGRLTDIRGTGVGVGVGVGVGRGAVTTVRAREFWVLAAKTRPEQTMEIKARTSAGIKPNLCLLNPIQFAIESPNDSVQVQ